MHNSGTIPLVLIFAYKRVCREIYRTHESFGTMNGSDVVVVVVVLFGVDGLDNERVKEFGISLIHLSIIVIDSWSSMMMMKSKVSKSKAKKADVTVSRASHITRSRCCRFFSFRVILIFYVHLLVRSCGSPRKRDTEKMHTHIVLLLQNVIISHRFLGIALQRNGMK